MKTLYLVRHAEPLRLAEVQSDEWPLSEQGREVAKRYFRHSCFKVAAHVYTSPLLRAMQTAQQIELPITVDSRLEERRTGRNIVEFVDCWLKQYEDSTFKCPDGESFDEVSRRVKSCIDDILAELNAGQSAIVISHAAAICAYLQQYCIINVTERATKTRKIIWRGRQVYEGKLLPLTCFQLNFCNGQLENIEPIL